MFLASLVVMPALLIVTLLSLVFAATQGNGWRALGIATLIALLSPVAFYAAGHVKDRIRFGVWAVSHPEQVREAAQQDRIISGWERWGMAGWENDSYLVSDRADTLGSLDAAAKWEKKLGLLCNVVDAQRVWSHLYIVTTYNCPFDGIFVPDG